MSEIDKEQLDGLDQQELIGKALAALNNDHSYLAMECLKQAAAIAHSSIIDSHLAYCLALNNQDFPEAIRLGQEAFRAEPNNPLFGLNLGRVYLLAGQKEDAIKVLRQGLSFTHDQQIIDELKCLGIRKPSIFPTLHRDHFLNKWGGIVLAKLRLR